MLAGTINPDTSEHLTLFGLRWSVDASGNHYLLDDDRFPQAIVTITRENGQWFVGGAANRAGAPYATLGEAAASVLGRVTK